MSISYLAAFQTAILVARPDLAGSISPVPVPPNASFPYVTVQQPTDEEVESLEGLSGLTNTTLQVNCWHRDYETAFSLRASLRDPLLALTGAVDGSGLIIQAINYRGTADLFDGVREL